MVLLSTSATSFGWQRPQTWRAMRRLPGLTYRMLRILFVEERVGLLWVCRRIPAVGAFPGFREARLDMRLAQDVLVCARPLRDSRR